MPLLRRLPMPRSRNLPRRYPPCYFPRSRGPYRSHCPDRPRSHCRCSARLSAARLWAPAWAPRPGSLRPGFLCRGLFCRSQLRVVCRKLLCRVLRRGLARGLRLIDDGPALRLARSADGQRIAARRLKRKLVGRPAVRGLRAGQRFAVRLAVCSTASPSASARIDTGSGDCAAA